MSNFNEKLAKSLDEIEAMADDVLAKSLESETADEDTLEKGVKADEISKDDEKAPTEKDTKPVTDPDDEEDEDKEDEETDEKDEDDSEDTKKSFYTKAVENDTIAKSIEVSDFLESFLREHSNQIDDVRADISKSLETSTHTATILAKSFGAIMKSQEGLTNLVKSQATQLESQGALIKSLQERLNDVERQPVQRKSVATPIEKSFNHSAGLETGVETVLSKGEKIQRLTQFAMEGKHGVTVNDVVTFESNGMLRPELEAVLSDNK